MSAELDPGYRLTPVEALSGLQIGADTRVGPLPRVAGRTGRWALEQAVLEGLRRPPCGVSFSGGRDSSLVLAVAAHVARREGLPLPVPMTNVFPADPASEEGEFQDLVVRHLQLPEWQRFVWDDELDVVGPYAQRVLLRHGLVAPFNSHFHLPLFDAAAGGSLLTGIGGDELFEPVARRLAARVRYAGHRPGIRQLPRLAFAVAPTAVRTSAARFRPPFTFPWIRSGVHREIVRDFVRWHSREPLGWDESMRSWWWRDRSVQANIAVKRAMGAAVGTAVIHPLVAPGFLAAYAGELGPAGPASRTSAVNGLAGDLLPEVLISRRTKASFGGAFWTPRGRAFAESASGDSIDPGLADPERVRAAWLDGEQPHSNSYGLLQQEWLRHQRPQAAMS